MRRKQGGQRPAFWSLQADNLNSNALSVYEHLIEQDGLAHAPQADHEDASSGGGTRGEWVAYWVHGTEGIAYLVDL